ncbi:Ubiquinone biosynthesis protein coq-8, putative [Ricinus communis]|uniref:Ubiquinone biosynthesis protein coq-8, putative n=1 Tax=Ricinus communis TaxID=3988 RepID=B9SD05_RICCO|nr:Ubiquinone biosynthesis protein coq-8, putative [Ricinus communis]
MTSLVLAGGYRFTSGPCLRPTVRTRPRVRAALVEARPRTVPATRDINLAVGGDRTEDLQAEARAMARAANSSAYSPELLASKYGSKPIEVLRRTLEILTALSSFALKLYLDQRNGVFNINKKLRATELRRIFTRLGPTFVKLGQGLSTRPDICPPEYLEELSELQDALPTFPDEEAFSCIEKELGLPLDSIFSSISPSPIAAASLGQVYKAQLKSSGHIVAVKVQRPGIEEAIGLDFYLIRGLGILINKYVDIITSDVVALIDEFARRVYQELNYVQEGQNARRFRKLYADKEDILVPDIYWDYTSGKILTMEWVNGVKLNEQNAIERQGLKVLDLVNTGIQCSLRQLLEYGYFHADPHPGNLLATPEGKLAFLDFGMMSETPEEARSAIIGHVVHMVNRDYEAMARDYYALDFLSRDVDVSPIVPALQNFFDDALSYTVSELNFKTLVDGLGAVFYQYPFNVPAYYALILRSLTVLEGLALYADPNFKVLAASYPYFAKRLLTDPNPYLRDALIELLFKDGRFRHME